MKQELCIKYEGLKVNWRSRERGDGFCCAFIKDHEYDSVDLAGEVKGCRFGSQKF